MTHFPSIIDNNIYFPIKRYLKLTTVRSKLFLRVYDFDSLYSSRSFGSAYDFGSPLVTLNKDPIEGDPKSVMVVKRSKNPYEDFKWSMLEMIMEKEMYSVKDLEQLLQRFLSLNSVHYHGAIIEAFAEVWGDLFGNATDSAHVY